MRDPLGGINSLWPLFGIANQLLAAIALCVATTILLKMHGAKYVWITCVPLAWLVTVTFTAALAEDLLAASRRSDFWRRPTGWKPPAAARRGAAATRTLIFNARLDARVCGVLMVLVAAILLDSMRVWIGILRGTRDARVLRSAVRGFATAGGGTMKRCGRFGDWCWRCCANWPTRAPTSGTWRRTAASHSGEEWRRFSDERLSAKYARPKCC